MKVAPGKRGVKDQTSVETLGKLAEWCASMLLARTKPERHKPDQI